jgi:hypothetical protein
MNRPGDPLCRYIKSEKRYESWAELLDALKREASISGMRVVQETTMVQIPSNTKIERMMSLACPKRKRYTA